MYSDRCKIVKYFVLQGCEACDPVSQFNCGDHCIDIVRKCDGIFDCKDSSDEVNCQGKQCSLVFCSFFYNYCVFILLLNPFAVLHLSYRDVQLSQRTVSRQIFEPNQFQRVRKDRRSVTMGNVEPQTGGVIELRIVQIGQMSGTVLTP